MYSLFRYELLEDFGFGVFDGFVPPIWWGEFEHDADPNGPHQFKIGDVFNAPSGIGIELTTQGQVDHLNRLRAGFGSTGDQTLRNLYRNELDEFVFSNSWLLES